MQSFLIVVDMQNDFVTGALGSPLAKDIVPAVVNRVKEAFSIGETIIFTRDTHEDNYLNTREGKFLPVSHCIKGTNGWQIIDELKQFYLKSLIIDKPTFGSEKLVETLKKANEIDKIERVTIIGLCTDICVISNAMMIKNALPEVDVVIDKTATAGVTKESKEHALLAMKSCQIIIENE